MFNLVVLSVALLMMQAQFSNADAETSQLVVEIVASYDPPSTFTLSPPSYRAASPLSLTCEVQGLDDHTGLLYDWSSSVCAGNCFSKLGTSKTVSTDYLHSYDTGVHTCMVYDTLGCKANASISIKVVGAGVFVETVSEALPNNSLITTVSSTQHLTPNIRCLSGSSKARVGRIIGPLGNDITFLTSDPFLIARGTSADPGTMFMRTQLQLDLNNTGIYTYRTPDENADTIDFNFGIYLHDYADPPLCSDLDYVLTEGLHTLTCVSHGSPPTQVMWERDGERIYQNDTNFQFSQILVERTSSTYNNTLTINGTIEDVVGEYSCTVSNTLGSSNELIKTVKALEVSGHESPVIVGLTRSVICSTHLEVMKMEWLLVGVAEPMEQSEDGGQNLTLPINPTDTGLDGTKFTCKLTTVTGKVFEETVTIEVKELTHTVDITGPSNPLSAGGKHILTCTVTSDLSPAVKWLDPDNNEVDGSDVAVVMDDMVADGNTTTLLLHFDPLKTSHGGTYACVSTISEPTSFRRMTRDLQVQITSDSTTVTRSPSTSTVYTSDGLSLTCVTTVSEAVDIPVQVTHQWVGPGGVVTTNSLVSVSSVTSSERDYSSTVFFSSLRSSHSGTYTCSSTVSAEEASVFIATSAGQTASTSFDAAIRVTIEITYSSPGIYPVYSPPNYRAASEVTLQCVASGYSGSISYHWTSTCSSCFASNSYSQTISNSWLKTGDAGVHTCSVTDGLGNTGSNSTTMRIVGIGVYVATSQYTHTSSSSGGVQPSNTFATTQRYSSTRVSVFCCSNTTSTNNGLFTIPAGYEYSSNFGSYGRITRYSSYDTYAGCIQLRYYYGSYWSSSWYPSHYNYDGIHTCKLPDSNGNDLYENFGIYNPDWSTSLAISQLYYNSSDNGLVTLTCATLNSPPSIIRWYRDDTLLDIDGYSTNMSVVVTDRHNSYFDITLTVCDTPTNVVGTYKCEAGNRFGMDNETYFVNGLELQCNKNTYVVGETVTCSCSSDIGGDVTWTSSTGVTFGAQSSIFVDTDSHGDVYTCSLSSSCGSQQESVTVDVTIPDEWATVDIQNSTGENALNNTDYILTCTVTVIEGITLPVTVEWVGSDGDVVTSEGNKMVGEVEVQGRVSTLSLSFSPVYFTDGGSYTCRTAISVSWLAEQSLQLSTTVEMPVTSQAMFQLKMFPLTHCPDWEVSKAENLEQNIKRELENAVKDRCNCPFSSSSIYSGQFFCPYPTSSKKPVSVTYRAVLNGTSDLLPADQLMEHIQDWQETEGTLRYNIFRLRLVKNCSLAINSFHDPW